MIRFVDRSVNALTIRTPLSFKWLATFDEPGELSRSRNSYFDLTIVISE